MNTTNTPENAEIIVQKLYSDLGIHRNPRKGTLKAPDEILENYNFSNKALIDQIFPDEFSLEETQNVTKKNTEELLKYNKPILSIGGDHSVSYPVIKTLKEQYPDLKLIWLDSHLDLKEKIEDNVSHDVVVRELVQEVFDEEEIIFVGITRKDKDEKNYLEDQNLTIYNYDEIEQFLEEFKTQGNPIYLSVDIDVLKPDAAPGTGYLDGKLDFKQVKKVIETVQPNHADLVEVAPPFDKNDRTIEEARKILQVIENNFRK